MVKHAINKNWRDKFLSCKMQLAKCLNYQCPPRIVTDYANHRISDDCLDQDQRERLSGLPEKKLLAILYPETEFVGRGNFSFVIGHPTNPNMVIAYNIFSSDIREDPIRAKEIYHMHRILSVLFPRNFPKFAAVIGGENAQSIRQRVFYRKVGRFCIRLAK